MAFYFYMSFFSEVVNPLSSLELVKSLTSSSFINALRRFISVRWFISLLRCDQASTFVGAEIELQDLLTNNCQIEFRWNPPASSQMYGVLDNLLVQF